MPIYEYSCEDCGEVTESLRKMIDRECLVICPACGGKANYKISAVRFELEGITGDYPTAYDQWEKKRRQKQAQEQKREQ